MVLLHLLVIRGRSVISRVAAPSWLGTLSIFFFSFPGWFFVVGSLLVSVSLLLGSPRKRIRMLIVKRKTETEVGLGFVKYFLYLQPKTLR